MSPEAYNNWWERDGQTQAIRKCRKRFSDGDDLVSLVYETGLRDCRWFDPDKGSPLEWLDRLIRKAWGRVARRANAKKRQYQRSEADVETVSKRERRHGIEGKRLTDRQKQVLLLTFNGKLAGEVGDILCLSPRTVQYHLTSAYRVLGLEARPRGSTQVLAALHACLRLSIFTAEQVFGLLPKAQ